MNLFISFCLLLCLVFVNVLCYHREHSNSDGYHYQKAYPQDVMVDVINNFGMQLLEAHNEGNNNNMALSPYGATSVLIALGEGVRGYAVDELQHAVHIPEDISVVRIGLRDIHRHLKSYFIPKEGFLAGLTLSNEKVPLNEEYQEILRFYGFDLDSFNNPLYPDINETTTTGMVFMVDGTEDPGLTSTFLPTETTTTAQTITMTTSSDIPTMASSSESTTSTGIPDITMTTSSDITTSSFESTTSTGIPEITTHEVTTTEKSTTKIYTRSTDAVSKDIFEKEASTLPISTPSIIETTTVPKTSTQASTETSVTEESTRIPTTFIPAESVTTILPVTALGSTTDSSSMPSELETTTTTNPTNIQTSPTTSLASVTNLPITESAILLENGIETTTAKVTTEPTTITSQASSSSSLADANKNTEATTNFPITENPIHLEKEIETSTAKLITEPTTIISQTSSSDSLEDTNTKMETVTTLDVTTNLPITESAILLEDEVETTTTKLMTNPTTSQTSPTILTTENEEMDEVTTSMILRTTESSSTVSSNEEVEEESESISESSSEEQNVIVTTSVTQSVTKVTTEYQTSSTDEAEMTSTAETSSVEAVLSTLPSSEVTDDSTDLIAISTETTSNGVEDYLTSTIMPDMTTSTEIPENTTIASSKRSARSVIDYIIARYYDNQLIRNPNEYHYVPDNNLSFLVYGNVRESHINFMTYDAVLPIAYLPVLNAVALSFPLDSMEYYLLLILPVDETGVDRLIHDMSHTASLRGVITSLKYAHVRAVIPSFMLKGRVNLTPALQKLGIQRIFEPRQTDFSLMTQEKDVYVTNVEQDVTVTIRNYVDPDNLPNYRNLQRSPPVEFKVDHPFLYFVMDTEIHVALMAGKIVNPLNSRIR